MIMLITNNTPTNEEPFSRADIRATQRYIKTRKYLASFATVAILALLVGIMYVNYKPSSVTSITKMFSEKTTDLRIFTPSNSLIPTDQTSLKKLLEFNEKREGDADTYLNTFSRDINSVLKFKENHPWLTGIFGQSLNPDGKVNVYKISKPNEVKKFFLSDECHSTVFTLNCGEDNFILKNGWLVTGDKAALSNYNEQLKNPLTKNEAFKAQTKESFSNSVVSLWTDSKNITSLLPLNLNTSFPSDARTALGLRSTLNGIAIHGSFYKENSKNAFFTKAPLTDSMKKLPFNTVMAISLSDTSESMNSMVQDQKSFINTEKEWKELRTTLEGYGLKVPENLKDVFGTTTTFSLNEGSVGNKVSGTLRISNGNKEKIVDILTKASAENKEILEMYVLKQDGKDLVIESHSPIINEKTLVDNPKFNEVFQDTSSSVALAYIDIDNNNKLLDSSYVIPEVGNGNGTLGINLSHVSDQELNYVINWSFLDR